MEQQNSSSLEFNKPRQGKKTAPWKILLYIICGAVVAVYGYVFWLGRKPEVSREYRMYFMEHTLSDWPGEGRFTYVHGTKEYCLAYNKYELNQPKLCLRKGQGWSNVSDKGSQFSGEDANIYYPIESGLKEGGYVKMEINEFTGKSSVDVYIKYSKDGLPKNQDPRKLFDESGQTEEKIGSISASGEYKFRLPEIKDGDLAQVIFKTSGEGRVPSSFILYWIEVDGE